MIIMKEMHYAERLFALCTSNYILFRYKYGMLVLNIF